MQPQVRDLQALIAEQTAALQPQFGLIDQDIASTEQSGQAQQAGLEATKTRAFKQIGQASQDKGMFFSGFSPNEEGEYTAGTYLPALAQLQATIAQTRNSLLGKKADLSKGAFDAATGMREQDLSRANDWNTMQEQARIAAVEAEKNRAFEAAQNAAKIRSDESIAAGNRAASARASASSQPSPAQNMAAALSSKTGGDGFVSPGTYQSLKNQWVAGGYGDSKSFDATFAGYRNPKNTAYKIG